MLKTIIKTVALAKPKKIKCKQKLPQSTGDVTHLKKNYRNEISREKFFSKSSVRPRFSINNRRKQLERHFSDPQSHSFITSTSKCEEFDASFRDKIIKTRLDLNQVTQNAHKPLFLDTFPMPNTAMQDFAVDKATLRNVVMQLPFHLNKFPPKLWNPIESNLDPDVLNTFNRNFKPIISK